MTYALALDRGGVERAQMRLVADWLAVGRQVTLLLGHTTPDIAVPSGTEVVTLGRHPYLALAAALPAKVGAIQPDILFCPGSFYTSAAAFTRLRLGRKTPPIVAKVSNASDRADQGRLIAAAHRRWLMLHGHFIDHAVAMSDATATAAARAMAMAGRVSVIPNPPPRNQPHAPPLDLPPGPVILGVGRLEPQKRWDRLIDALPRLPDDVSLVILGEGSMRPALAARAMAKGVATRVLMPGQVADPLPTMARASVVALTSDYEGVPGVLREALSVGTPVVATDSSPAIGEIIADRRQGAIVPRDDPAALAAALCHWLTAPRPAPVPMTGADAAARYLALFDRLA